MQHSHDSRFPIPDFRPSILFITHRVPYPPDKGDRIRTYHLLKFLAERCRVYLATLADEVVPKSTREKLEQICQRVCIVPIGGVSRLWHGFASLIRGGAISEGMFYSPVLIRTVTDWCREHDFHAGIASASSVATYLNPLMRSGKRTLVDLVDVDSEKWVEYAAKSSFPKSLLYSLEGRRLRKVESRLCQSVSELTLVSQGEVKLFDDKVMPNQAKAITNGVDLNYFSRTEVQEAETGCVFVGAMDYKPNIDAAVWFAREIWPRIRARFPSHSFQIVGRNPTSGVVKLQEIPGVEVVGTVPDVRDYVRRAAVSVAPLRIARGLQNKVLEALAMGRPVVASPQALSGFSAVVPARAAQTPEEWVEQICYLLSNVDERRTLSEQGRQFAETYHDWTRCLEPLAQLLDLNGAVPSLTASEPSSEFRVPSSEA